jgi:CubicO group peptidase (beta-lactamase class C family)
VTIVTGCPVPDLVPPVRRRRDGLDDSDFARYGQMLLNGGSLDGKTYLRPATFAAMTTDHIGPGSGVARNYFYYPGDGFGFGYGKFGLLDAMRPPGYGIYLVHYIFIIWLQYAVYDYAWPAGAKAAIVFAGTLALSWGLTAMLRRIPAVAWMI